MKSYDRYPLAVPFTSEARLHLFTVSDVIQCTRDQRINNVSSFSFPHCD